MAEHLEKRDDSRITLVSRGELDNIYKPSSSGVRSGNGSRTRSGEGSAISRHKFSAAPTLELLTTEEITGESSDLDLEDMDSVSGSSSFEEEENVEQDMMTTGRSSVMFGVAEPLPDSRALPTMDVETDEDDDIDLSKQMILYGVLSDEEEIDSEEERDIVKEIREEIQQQVKKEMKEELAVMRAHIVKNAEPENKNSDLDGLDPELKLAILKMRKLDRILLKKMKKEKRVKKDRILLQQRLREELEELKKGGKSEPSEEKKNTEKYFALALPPSHNIGVTMDDEDDEVLHSRAGSSFSPVFPTQVLDDAAEASRKEQAGSTVTSARSSHTAGSASIPSSSNRSRSKHKNHQQGRGKDFIKRNAELAADAQNTIAMTDDEKKRLGELLADLDALPDIPDETDSVDGSSSLISNNPYQITLSCGEGFTPLPQEMKRLDAIDSRLKMLLPPEDFESICGTSRSGSSMTQPAFFSRTHQNLHPVEIDHLGEKALKDTKEHRDLKQRLSDIEQELQQLSTVVEIEIDTPSLSGDQLDELLDQCARTMSRATAETDNLSQSSARSTQTVSRQSLYQNPPHLPDETLQMLLAEAKAEAGVASLTNYHQGRSLNDNMMLESVTEETVQELLNNPRAVSQAGSRAASRLSSRASVSPGLLRPADELDNPLAITGHSCDDYDISHNIPQPFLPAIDPTGTMSTQRQGNPRLNNDESCSSRPSSGQRGMAVTVRNSLSDNPSRNNVIIAEALRENRHSPQPPSAPRSASSNSLHRNISPPFTKNSLD